MSAPTATNSPTARAFRQKFPRRTLHQVFHIRIFRYFNSLSIGSLVGCGVRFWYALVQVGALSGKSCQSCTNPFTWTSFIVRYALTVYSLRSVMCACACPLPRSPPPPSGPLALIKTPRTAQWSFGFFSTSASRHFTHTFTLCQRLEVHRGELPPAAHGVAVPPRLWRAHRVVARAHSRLAVQISTRPRVLVDFANCSERLYPTSMVSTQSKKSCVARISPAKT